MATAAAWQWARQQEGPGHLPTLAWAGCQAKGGFSQELITALRRLPGFLGSGRPGWLPQERFAAAQAKRASGGGDRCSPPTPSPPAVTGGLAAVCRTHSWKLKGKQYFFFPISKSLKHCCLLKGCLCAGFPSFVYGLGLKCLSGSAARRWCFVGVTGFSGLRPLWWPHSLMASLGGHGKEVGPQRPVSFLSPGPLYVFTGHHGWDSSTLPSHTRHDAQPRTDGAQGPQTCSRPPRLSVSLWENEFCLHSYGTHTLVPKPSPQPGIFPSFVWFMPGILSQ